MEGIAAEVSQKLKSAIKAKLMELGAYVDEELPNYVMVMVTNRRSKIEMDRELNLFLGGNTSTFTSWLQSVWTKLEQVTVANLGVEKKKLPEKKKKVRKSAKSSSESDDDRKHKKKRKSSTTSETHVKESKKRKSIKGEIDETEAEYSSKEVSEENPISSKKLRDSNKSDVRSNMDLEPDNDADDSLSVETKKSFKDASVLDEDDFLNIKEDFETEFLSDEELESKGKNKPVPSDHKKTLAKLAVVEKSDDGVHNSNKRQLFTEKSTKVEPEKVIDRSKDKENKNTENSVPNAKENENRPKTTGKTILIRTRKVVKSRSRSRSRSCRSRSPSLPKIQSRVKGPASISPSKSRSNSPIINNVIKIREKSPVLDARELINRKRALQNAVHERSSKEDKIPLKRALIVDKNDDIVLIRDGTEKENDLRERLLENSKIEKTVENKMGRVLLSREGKRSVLQAEERFSSVSRANNDKIDLRKIKRTVYVRNEDNLIDEVDEKTKIHKSVVNQIAKYIKDDPVVSSTVVKVPKISRPKGTPAQSASSTLIRKAMADAHKSLTTKEEQPKKRDVHDVKHKPAISNKKEQKNLSKNKIEAVEDDSNDVEVITTESSTAIDQEDEDMNSLNAVDENKESRLREISGEVEEYDPSQNMPQFVVTLTGLDPKLFPEDDMELNENLDLESSPNDQQELFFSDAEENKIKPKLPEQCKYYPNCLAGDQCLYHHPTIPCKMFPNCKYGNSCLYIHPKCKFDAACTRYDCPFLHTAPRMTAPVAARHTAVPTAISAQSCKFYYNCVNPVCPFQHPKICRYDRHCMNKNCTYQHTSLSHVNSFSKDKLKWSKPKNEADDVKQENNIANEM